MLSKSVISAYESCLAENRERHLRELFELLRIPSISTLPEYSTHLRAAAEWIASWLREAGLERVAVMDTGGAPAVYGQWLHAPDRPTVLIYGHYDVQPPGPSDQWDSPPFAPEVRDGKLFARGVSDMKGQLFMNMVAVAALLRSAGRLPVNVKFLIEGEEEIGSTHLRALLRRHAELFQADVCLISDSELWAPDVPNIIYSLRGLTSLEVHLQTGVKDLHSGMFGGAVPNAIHALVELLASLRDSDGRIRVAGFYDQVAAVPPEELAAWQQLGFDEEQFRLNAGVTELYGEAGYSLLERLWARPTLELNGIRGGFGGQGVMTIVVAEASAKITCRLVPNQHPQQVASAIERHLREHVPPGASLRVEIGELNHPVLIPRDQPFFAAASEALASAFGRPPVFTRYGASIPVVEVLLTELGVPSLLTGFALNTDNHHSPNEHFHLRNYDRGLSALGRLLINLGSQAG